ncbi:hypothetical protein MMPV_003989 [Pyropia vietnamensis]
MPAGVRSALARGRALATRPARAARRRGKAAHTFSFALTPTRLAALPAGSYRLRFCRGVKVAVTSVVELGLPALPAASAAATESGLDWPASGGCMTLLATLYRRERSHEDIDDDRDDNVECDSGGGEEVEGEVLFDAKDATVALLRVSLSSRTEAMVGKAHIDLAAYARVPAGSTPLTLHLGGAVVELLVGTVYVARGSSRVAGSEASSSLSSLSLGSSTDTSLSLRAPSNDATSRASSVPRGERRFFGGGEGRGEGGARGRARRAEAEAARLRLEVAAMKAELAAMRVGHVNLRTHGGGGDGSSRRRGSWGGAGGSGGGWAASAGPLPCGVTVERLLAELLDTKGALAAAVDARLTLEWVVGQARRDDPRLATALAELFARYASQFEEQMATATTERGEGR